MHLFPMIGKVPCSGGGLGHDEPRSRRSPRPLLVQPERSRPVNRRQTSRAPFNFTPTAVNSISSGSPHVRPMGRTCGEPDETKEKYHPKNITALFRGRGSATSKPIVIQWRGIMAGPSGGGLVELVAFGQA